MNRKFMTKCSNFILGNGFYIALTLCISLIVLSGYYLLNSVSTTTNLVAPVTGNVDLVVPDLSELPVALPEMSKPLETPTPELPAEVPVEQIMEEILPENLEEDEKNLEEETFLPEPISFTWPVDGEVTQSHSLDVLVFNSTMGDWRVHAGIDITATEGTAVMAVADGEVMAVYHDDMLGTTVVIAHQDGLETSYSNLGEFPTVDVGNYVKSGQIIAVVGQSSLAESGSAPHLQLTMTQDGELVDPLDYLLEDDSESAETMSTDEYALNEDNLH